MFLCANCVVGCTRHTDTGGYLPNRKYLVNEHTEHAYLFSGVLPWNYERFCDGAGIGRVFQKARDEFFETYKAHIQQEYAESTEIGPYNFGTGSSADGDDV